VLAPHHAEHAELGEGRRAAEPLAGAGPLLLAELVRAGEGEIDGGLAGEGGRLGRGGGAHRGGVASAWAEEGEAQRDRPLLLCCRRAACTGRIAPLGWAGFPIQEPPERGCSSRPGTLGGVYPGGKAMAMSAFFATQGVAQDRDGVRVDV